MLSIWRSNLQNANLTRRILSMCWQLTKSFMMEWDKVPTLRNNIFFRNRNSFIIWRVISNPKIITTKFILQYWLQTFLKLILGLNERIYAAFSHSISLLQPTLAKGSVISRPLLSKWAVKSEVAMRNRFLCEEKLKQNPGEQLVATGGMQRQQNNSYLLFLRFWRLFDVFWRLFTSEMKYNGDDFLHRS